MVAKILYKLSLYPIDLKELHHSPELQKLSLNSLPIPENTFLPNS